MSKPTARGASELVLARSGTRVVARHAKAIKPLVAHLHRRQSIERPWLVMFRTRCRGGWSFETTQLRDDEWSVVCSASGLKFE